MQLDHDDIQEFKSIYREEFGEELSDAEAHDLASRVMRLYELLARPLAADTPPPLKHPRHEIS